MLYIVIFFLGFSFFLYALLGGADYGAGIVELFSSEKNQEITKKTIYRVMGPVWEANHIWIIIVIVILWIAFPQYYNVLVVNLHIPLTIMLLGVTLRGVAFVFRHYDAVKDDSQYIYDLLFKISSLITPMFLGMIFGALISGRIVLLDANQTQTFYEIYVSSWTAPLSILIGAFFTTLCAFLSSVLLIGEAAPENEKMYRRKSTIATIVVVLLGLITLSYGYVTENKFIIDFLHHRFALVIVGISAIVLIPLWKAIRKGNKIWSRFYAGLQMFLILFAIAMSHYPNMIITRTGSLSLLDGVAPEAVIQTLGIALIIGGSIILPGLFHLLKSFKMIKILER